MFRRIAAFFFICAISLSAALLPSARGEEAKAEVSADRAAVYIGDRIRYTINVQAKPGATVEFPKPGKELGPFEVKDSGISKSQEEKNGEIRRSQWYLLASYKTGKQSIPALDIKYKAKGASGWSILKTKELTVEVKSLLSENPKAADIKDIKGILPIESRVVRNILFLIAALIFAAMLVLWVRKVFFKGALAGPKPAHVIAYEELERIKMSALLAEGNFREYYFRLSNCIRRYLENRFALRAPEMTTEEFLGAVRDSGVLDAKNKDLLKSFLLGADMVKFAKYGPARQEAESSYEFAKRFIDETKEPEKTTLKSKR